MRRVFLVFAFLAFFGQMVSAGKFCLCDGLDCSSREIHSFDSFFLECGNESYIVTVTGSFLDYFTLRFDTGTYHYRNFSNATTYLVDVGGNQFGVEVLDREGITYWVDLCKKPYCSEDINLTFLQPLTGLFTRDEEIPVRILLETSMYPLEDAVVYASLGFENETLNEVSVGLFNTSFSVAEAGDYTLSITAVLFDGGEEVARAFGEKRIYVTSFPLEIEPVRPLVGENFDTSQVAIRVRLWSSDKAVSSLIVTAELSNQTTVLDSLTLDNLGNGLYGKTLSGLADDYYSLNVSAIDYSYTYQPVSKLIPFSIGMYPPVVNLYGLDPEYDFTNFANFSAKVYDGETGQLTNDSVVKLRVYKQDKVVLQKNLSFDKRTDRYWAGFNCWELGAGDYDVRIVAERGNNTAVKQQDVEILSSSKEYQVLLEQPRNNSVFPPSSRVLITAKVFRNGVYYAASPQNLYVVVEDLLDSSTTSLLLYDDGTHGDVKANDGIPSANFSVKEGHNYSIQAKFLFKNIYTFVSDKRFFSARREFFAQQYPALVLRVLEPNMSRYPVGKAIDMVAEVLGNGSLLEDASVSARLGNTGVSYSLQDVGGGRYEGSLIAPQEGSYSLFFTASRKGFSDATKDASFRVEEFEPSLRISTATSHEPRLFSLFTYYFNVSSQGGLVSASEIQVFVNGKPYSYSMLGTGRYYLTLVPNLSEYEIKIRVERGYEYGEVVDELKVSRRYLFVEFLSPLAGTVYSPNEPVGVLVSVKDDAGNPVHNVSVKLTVTSPEGEEVQYMDVLNDTFFYEYTPQREAEYNLLVTATKQGFRMGADTLILNTAKPGFQLPTRVEKNVLVILISLALVVIIAYYFGIV